MLTVRIPKPEQRQPRRVEIKAATESNGNGSHGGQPEALEGTATEK